jgi:hypothetical protein
MSAQPGARESCSPRAQQASRAPASQRAHGASRRTLRVGLAAHYATTARICPVQLWTHVESWSYRASHPDGRLLSPAQAGEAWFHEEYEPMADLVDELGIARRSRACRRPVASCRLLLFFVGRLGRMAGEREEHSSSVGRRSPRSSTATPASSNRRTASTIVHVRRLTGSLTVSPSAAGGSSDIGARARTAVSPRTRRRGGPRGARATRYLRIVVDTSSQRVAAAFRATRPAGAAAHCRGVVGAAPAPPAGGIGGAGCGGPMARAAGGGRRATRASVRVGVACGRRGSRRRAWRR